MITSQQPIQAPKTVLIDRRNHLQEIPRLLALIGRSKFIGLDLETEDSRRHDGLNRFCKYSEDGFKAKTSKTVFDWRRTNICGASFYSEEEPDTAFYINFGHADVGNQLDKSLLLQLLRALPEGSHWIAHNSAFEQTVIQACLGYEFPPGSIICSMTMAVSAYGPDTYSRQAWYAAGQGEIGTLVRDLIKHATTGWNPETQEMSPQLSELVYKIIGKSSKAAFSWNGFVAAIAYGYGLKQAVLSHFNYKMQTFEETLDGEAHMGLVTGEQVADYGADDAYWAVRLFRKLLDYMLANGGMDLVNVFFEQENPMPKVFADISIGGMRVNHAAILARTKVERATAARVLREIKAAARNLSFPAEYNPVLLKYEKWYGAKASGDMGADTYREKVQTWLDAPDEVPLRDGLPVKDPTEAEIENADYRQCLQVRGPVSNGWAAENGLHEKALTGVNLSHYMPVRTIIYDLLGCKPVVSFGKVQSDGEARGRTIDRLKDGRLLTERQIRDAFVSLSMQLRCRIEAGGEDGLAAGVALEELNAKLVNVESRWRMQEDATREDTEPFAVHHHRHELAVLDGLNKLAGVEQRMKLYLTPYNLLVDPETGCMYPSVSSLLATRRLSASNPNAMQLGKRGESAYVRGFFLGDRDDHMIVSLDWSSVELVEIGEFSGDPAFLEAYSSIPHKDLHAGTATALLRLDCDGLNLELFKSLKTMTSWTDWLAEHKGEAERLPRLMTNLKGELIKPVKAYGYWRTVFGKEANFNYWYSGFLATIGERAGWSMQKTGDATGAYRDLYPVGEAWRVGRIQEVAMKGYVTLPDGHRYTRFEATQAWASEFCDKFFLETVGAENYNQVMRWIMRKIQKRSGNQTVNAEIQGTCATLAKRSIVRTILYFRSLGWTDAEFRFLMPIHDELVWSVRQDLVVQFVREAHRIMIDHGDIFKTCKLDSSPAVGITFEPWNAEDPRTHTGQIELFEPPEAVVGKDRAGKRLDDQGIADVVEYLKTQRQHLQKAA